MSMHEQQRRNVLVTGGMGFIGTAIVRRFAQRYRVTVADRLDFGMSPAIDAMCATGEVAFVETDLSTLSPLHDRVERGEFDVVVHLASLTHIPLCERFPEFAYQSNVLSALSLLHRVSPGCRVVNFSTSSTYAPEDVPHREADSPLMPVDFYGWTKRHVEDLARYYAAHRGISVLNIRPANAAGHGETNRKLLGTILEQLRAGGPVIELGNLSPRRDFIHVDDVAWVIDRLVEVWPVSPGTVETFNVGTGYEPVSVGTLVARMIELAGGGREVRSVGDRRRSAERLLLAVDVTKLRRTLPDYRPRRLEEWLPALVKDPGLRLDSRIERRLVSGRA